VEPQAVDVGIVGLECVAGQPLEAFVGCAKDVHRRGKTIRAFLTVPPRGR
jgi:hypothetical protein